MCTRIHLSTCFQLSGVPECCFHHSLTPEGAQEVYLDLLGQLWTPGIPPWASPSLSLGFVIAVVCLLPLGSQFSREQGLCPSAHMGTLAHGHGTQGTLPFADLWAPYPVSQGILPNSLEKEELLPQVYS